MLVDFQASASVHSHRADAAGLLRQQLHLIRYLMGVFGWALCAARARVVLSAVSQPYANAVIALGASPWRLYLATFSPMSRAFDRPAHAQFPADHPFGNLIIFPWAGHPATPDQSWPDSGRRTGIFVQRLVDLGLARTHHLYGDALNGASW